MSLEDSGRDHSWKLLVNLITRFLLSGVKLTAFFYTGFLVLLSEALNSLVDIAVTGSLFLGSRASRRAPDEEHPFGHQRLSNIVSLIVAVTFITVTTVQILREAIPRFFYPVALAHPQVALYVLGFSFVVNLIPIALILAGREREITLKTALYDNINDELTIIASGIGVWAVTRGFYLGDPLAAIVVALIIATNSFILIRENADTLLGRAPDAVFYDRVRATAYAVEGVRGVRNLTAEYVGPKAIHLDLDVELAPETTIEEAERIAAEVVARLRALGVVSCRVQPRSRSQATPKD